MDSSQEVEEADVEVTQAVEVDDLASSTRADGQERPKDKENLSLADMVGGLGAVDPAFPP